ncbi:hypothetical protein DWX10_17200 [Clostridium sp. AF18-27]|nr:hypothetical protein DWX10_17200 [Clostridium sp. AF18-27]
MTGEPERRDTLGAGEAAGTRERWPGAGEAAGTGETAWRGRGGLARERRLGRGERYLAQEWTGLAAARPAKRLSGRCGDHINLRR